MALSTQTDFYLNLSQLSKMKLDARENTADASRSVAQQFESLFIQQMLAAMRSAATVDENSHSSYTDFYQEMHDKQLALTMAKQGGLGLTKFIMQQLPGGQINSGGGGESLPLHNFQEATKTPVVKKIDYQPENPAVIVKPYIHGDIVSASQTGTKSSPSNNWGSSQAFIRDILPEAKSAATTLGISPGVLIAQSVLETGWGKHVMDRPDGSSAFNLFGIKAGSNWSGDRVDKPTLEFRDGVMRTEFAHFRAYASAADSFKDYVRFIQSNERYRDALDHGGNDVHYVKSLQEAGYATDPEYANKILSIMQGSQLQQTLSGETTHA